VRFLCSFRASRWPAKTSHRERYTRGVLVTMITRSDDAQSTVEKLFFKALHSLPLNTCATHTNSHNSHHKSTHILSLSRTHITHVYIHIHMYMHTRDIYTCLQMCTNDISLTHTHTHPSTLSRSLTHTHSLSRTLELSRNSPPQPSPLDTFLPTWAIH
jgi:hypothetical protein